MCRLYRQRLIAVIVAATIPLTMAGKCGGASTSPAASNASPSQSWCFDRPCSDAVGVPAAPTSSPAQVGSDLKMITTMEYSATSGACFFYMSPGSQNGISVFDGIHVDGRITVKCLIPANKFTITLSVEWRDTAGVWHSMGATTQSTPLPGADKDTTFAAAADHCVKGVWSILFHFSGVVSGPPLYRDIHMASPTEGVRTPVFLTDCHPTPK